MSGRAVRAALVCVCAWLLQHANAEHIKCPAITDISDCHTIDAPCDSDDQCSIDQICCSTPCGKSCLDPLRTGCENVKLSMERIARALAEENPRGGRKMPVSVRAPRCRSRDGEFEEIQCDNNIVTSCWCVDATGFEIAGTRAPAASLVNCSRTAACAAHTCRMLCPLGFELDTMGCPLCKCRDPCASITCPGQLSCQMEETPCLKPPCPPVATCKRGRSLEQICPAGQPLLISETNRPFLCGVDPGKPNCPPLFKCLVERGNDYGVCCPGSLSFEKPSKCPAKVEVNQECGAPCDHDLECPSVQKCCDGGECGRHCVFPQNVTKCTQQQMLAELLVVSEKEGRGYVPQCTKDGAFEWRQCSRNGLVCWCVDSEGNKLRGSMGPSASVKCSPSSPNHITGRSMNSNCLKSLCAGVCEYGYKVDTDGCPTCVCDDPCAGYPCPEGEECVRVRQSDCNGELCTTYPICRPSVSYDNPCDEGVPATDDRDSLITCKADEECPDNHNCNHVRKGQPSVCCPDQTKDLVEVQPNATDLYSVDIVIQTCDEDSEALCNLNATSCKNGFCSDGQICCSTRSCGAICVNPTKMMLQTDDDSVPTMCEYLRDFDEKMEGTVDDMRLALPPPTCADDGSFIPKQCFNGQCWCVDFYGTEIPGTKTNNSSSIDCDKVRKELSCLDLTCRMGCDYGFELGENKCPTCRCREPCAGVRCAEGRVCAVIDVACEADYCPPVPACLPRKLGQCPYLVPSNDICEWSCRFDAECGPSERCCATGCGTACTKTVYQTACQQRRALALHDAAENGNPPSSLAWIPACREDGSYEQVQCGGVNKECWCVDTSGNETPGTRVSNSTPVCEFPSACPELTCNDVESCPHGRQLDASGCHTCECRDPCAEAKCRDDETCELMKLDCEGDSCAPLARCVPAPACPEGEPLRSPDNSTHLVCGPAAAECPSSHACRFAPHDSRHPVCCPKPRSVCFETNEESKCKDRPGMNVTRWRFNPERNRCERFVYQGCAGNHNNFRTKAECNSVCPNESSTTVNPMELQITTSTQVLSSCERLREKNEAAIKKYGRGPFIPNCDEDGAWESVQCMSHIDVCWCVSARGEPLKGSLVRGEKPVCNFRQARKWKTRDPLDEKAQTDEVLEELIRQMTVRGLEKYNDEEEVDEEEEQENYPEGKHTHSYQNNLSKTTEQYKTERPATESHNNDLPSSSYSENTDLNAQDLLDLLLPTTSSHTSDTPSTDSQILRLSTIELQRIYQPSTESKTEQPSIEPQKIDLPTIILQRTSDPTTTSEQINLSSTDSLKTHSPRTDSLETYSSSTDSDKTSSSTTDSDDVYQLNTYRADQPSSSKTVLFSSSSHQSDSPTRYSEKTDTPTTNFEKTGPSTTNSDKPDLSSPFSEKTEPITHTAMTDRSKTYSDKIDLPTLYIEKMESPTFSEKTILPVTHSENTERSTMYTEQTELPTTDPYEVDLPIIDMHIEKRTNKNRINSDTAHRVETVQPDKENASTKKSPEDSDIMKVKEKIVFKTKCQMLQEEAENRSSSDGFRPRCRSDGSFSPRQCSRGRCWCVDAAGHRRPSTLGIVADLPDHDPCESTQIESASLELELFNVEDAVAERSRKTMTTRLAALGARVPVSLIKDRGMMKIKVTVAGPKAVDIVYHVESWVKQEKLAAMNRSRTGGKITLESGMLGADVIRSEYRLSAVTPAMQQREIISEATMSSTTAYHTALVVLSATSAFIISVLCVIVMLYRARLQREPHKAERFLPVAPPVYVLSPDEKAELAKAMQPVPGPARHHLDNVSSSPQSKRQSF